MSQPLKFRAAIEDAGSGGTYVTVPFDVEQHFGKKRVKVKALIDGVFYRGSLVRMGGTCHILGVRKEIREQIGKTIGDEIEIALEEDTEPREVAIPQDLRSALDAESGAADFFWQLAYTHQKEYVRWIEEAKQDQTRQNRVSRTVQMLRQGKKPDR